jgi:hypothetical protein
VLHCRAIRRLKLKSGLAWREPGQQQAGNTTASCANNGQGTAGQFRQTVAVASVNGFPKHGEIPKSASQVSLLATDFQQPKPKGPLGWPVCERQRQKVKRMNT